MLSSRTKDETTGYASARLFSVANTPAKMLALGESEIGELIYPVGFYRTKARNLKKMCQELVRRHGGRVPRTMEELLGLPGVGRKTANLVIGMAFGQDGICVDTHVHRISNRLGYVETDSPHATERALREKLPRRYWIVVNGLMVAWGQRVCRPISPFCSRCDIEAYCGKIGVVRSR
jgi:endonuclease-3